MNGVEVLVPLVFLSGMCVALIIYISSRHRERMAMVEKGLSSDEIKAFFNREIRRDPFTSLKWGLLLIFGGLAVVIGNYLHDQYNINDGFTVGMVCLFAGCALLIYYGIASKRGINS